MYFSGNVIQFAWAESPHLHSKILMQTIQGKFDITHYVCLVICSKIPSNGILFQDLLYTQVYKYAWLFCKQGNRRMELGYKGWDQVGVMGTLYEEEEPSITGTAQRTPSAEQIRSTRIPVCGARFLNMARDTDVVIHVNNSSFKLHKEVLIARSGYLKRNLKELSEITLSSPVNISAETFKSVADFCYDNFVSMSPYNIAALRTAAELLEMTETRGPRDQNLAQKTESYFRDVVVVSSDYVSIVLRSTFSLLPEAETMSSLFSRCIEVLSLIEIDDAVHSSWLEGVRMLDSENLELLLGPISKRLTQCHDIIYMMIDVNLKKNGEKVSEEQKTRMCNYIDCSILSPQYLEHAVQNPIMSTRFVVRAMFIENQKTRQSIHYKIDEPKSSTTLGATFERDAALRQVEELKDVVTTTNKRIQTLENELSCMKLIVSEPGSVKGRSTSLRFSNEIDRKVARWQRGSQSSLNVRDLEGKARAGESTRVEKNICRKLINGLKSVFSLQGLSWNKKGESRDPGKIERKGGRYNAVAIAKDQAFHRQTSRRY